MSARFGWWGERKKAKKRLGIEQMADLSEPLFDIASKLNAISRRLEQPDVKASLESLNAGINKTAQAFCGSWIGYHSRVYYYGLNPPPPGARFSPEWGLMDRSFNEDTIGEWVELPYADVCDHLQAQTDGICFDELQQLASKIAEETSGLREELLSILTALVRESDDAYLARMLEQATNTRAVNASEIISVVQPKGSFMSRDSTAYSAGIQVPPHISVMAQVQVITSRMSFSRSLEGIARQTAAHVGRSRPAKRSLTTVGTKVFIGHGHSVAWRDVKDFVQDRLGLDWDEFNRVPVAGITNIARLSEMLNDAAIALVIMTAEDEMKDGKVRARENVVHEAGLFQGKLGFTKAIVVVEEGCEEFSNIHGLGQIRFPVGNIKSAFEDIRQVLEREGLLGDQQ